MVTTLPLSGKFAQRLRITPVTSAGRTDSGGRETPHPVREKRSGAGRRPRGHLASPTCDSPCRAGRCAATDGRNSDGHVDTAAPPGDRFRHAACRAAYPWDRLQRTDGPDHRPAFIALLTEIYAMAPHEYPADAPLDVPASQPGSHYRRMPPKLRCCRPSGLALPRVRSSRLTLTPDGVGLRSRNCCASRDTCGLDLAVP